jgi:hypothetical protein
MQVPSPLDRDLRLPRTALGGGEGDAQLLLRLTLRAAVP